MSVKTEELRQRLTKYKSEISAIDKGIDSAFKNTIDFTIRLSDPNKDYQKPFNETFFNNIPVIVAMCALNNFQNNVYLFENEVLAFCYAKFDKKFRQLYI